MIKPILLIFGILLSLNSATAYDGESCGSTRFPPDFFIIHSLFNDDGDQSVVGLLNRADDGSLSISPVNGSGSSTPMSVGNQVVANQVKGLQNLDLLQGSGQTSNAGLVLSGVDFVGLNRLIGQWAGSDSYIYDFQSFSHVSIGRQQTSVQSGTFSYALSPQADSTYNFFLALNGQVVLYTLTFNSDSELTLTTQDANQNTLTLTKFDSNP